MLARARNNSNIIPDIITRRTSCTTEIGETRLGRAIVDAVAGEIVGGIAGVDQAALHAPARKKIIAVVQGVAVETSTRLALVDRIVREIILSLV
jgi:hypothetical protein